MKLLWFHLMPYPELPEDFRQRASSVWVDIPSDLLDARVVADSYNLYLDQLEHADAVGFDGICVNEHHQNGYGLMPSPNLMAAALTRRTERAAIVVMGNSLALYNPPVRVAEEFAMLDCMSNGRLVAGFPVGTPMDTVFCYGQNPGTLRRKYHEAHDLIMRAWKEPEPFAFNGEFTQLRYVNPWPRPLQRPHPPVWIPGGGSIETWEWTAEMDYVYCYLSYFGYKLGKATMDGFWQRIEQLGYDDNPYRAGFLQFVGVADTDEEAMRLYKEPAEYFYGRCLHVNPGFADPPGYQSEATVRGKVQSMVAQAARSGGGPGGPLTWEDMVDKGYVIVGSPDTVREKLEEVATSLRVGHLMLLLQFGNMHPELVQQNTDLFADKVLPGLRGLWSDYEDRWWPEACA
ncbi:MAG TPA: LLM class flavin-dependent oxidoreductase [Acidimicrobiales bacterium]|nr:LLM class flavin-dependent oxidoreductase [Acidimicrobiales bacterium]